MGVKRYLYAKYPGARIRVGNHGEATYETPVEVPDSVADALDGAPDLVQTLDQRAPAGAVAAVAASEPAASEPAPHPEQPKTDPAATQPRKKEK